MISIDIYCIILYVHTWFLLFCHCTSYWWTTHFLETTTRPQQNQREKKNGRKNEWPAPVTVLQHEMIWDRFETSKVHAKVPPMPGSREVPCHLFPSEGFSRFVWFFFPDIWFKRHFLKLRRIGDGVCFLILVSWIWDERWMKKICAYRTLTCTSKVSEWTLRDLELLLSVSVS